jgi:predicted TIM-barrel fold metal-dependent hydrolase
MRPAFATTQPMRAAETNTKPVFAIPPGSCDTHFHVFEPGYPRVPDPLYTFPDATLAQYLRLLDFVGIERAVLVQPTYYAADNRLLLDVLRAEPNRLRGVVQVKDDVTDTELDSYHEAGVRGIRLDLFKRAEWPVDDLIAYIRAAAARTRPRGWHLQFYTPGVVVRELLPFLAAFEDTFVIDHIGYKADFDQLASIMDSGYCYVKLSGAYRVAGDKPLATVAPLATALVEAYPQRLVWGSDWPHLPNGQRDTGELINLLADWAPDPAPQQAILVDNPARLFFTEGSLHG